MTCIIIYNWVLAGSRQPCYLVRTNASTSTTRIPRSAHTHHTAQSTHAQRVPAAADAAATAAAAAADRAPPIATPAAASDQTQRARRDLRSQGFWRAHEARTRAHARQDASARAVFELARAHRLRDSMRLRAAVTDIPDCATEVRPPVSKQAAKTAAGATAGPTAAMLPGQRS